MQQSESTSGVRGTSLDLGTRTLEGIKDKIDKRGNKSPAKGSCLRTRRLIKPF